MATVIPDDVQSFKAAFEVFDHDKTGEISYVDFPNAVRAIGFNPTNNQVVEVLKAANKGEKDKINFDEFVDMLGKFNECRKEDAEESLREAFKLVSKTLSSVFFFFSYSFKMFSLNCCCYLHGDLVVYRICPKQRC